ncbi:MAG TPA: alpha/beta fold hydrolase [Aquihabitans sp.]|jgi:pimeloyl-ACP methyl ester carboxylesterase|nr:alpha/beta fold hydrolase [Aquihabitans sp.]
MQADLANGISLEYERHGDAHGEPVLLVMGLGAQLILWPPRFIERLTEAGYHVVAYDNRDVGMSSRVDAPAPTVTDLARSLVAPRSASVPYTLRDMADDAAGLLDHLGIERAHVVGVSMGGMIAQELAIGHPHRVATLTSIMSNTGARRTGKLHPALLPALLRSRRSGDTSIEAAIEVGRLIAGPHFDEAAVRDLEVLRMRRQGDPVVAQEGLARQTLAVTATRDRTADLRRVTAPTLVVHGILDRLVRPSGGMATARAVPGSRLVMYPDMAHDVPDVRVDEMTTEVIENCRRAPVSVPAGALA